ncbi:hypothetical protein EWU23_13140 [Cytophagaceae bacterium 50C-KIRBA]|uniref:Phage tail protein n=1 Tax=Aquirufa beregesia TaxID=2516556 RepID=A0ABX0F132_9BACT|nr:phage tail protein [Aquirufa beregesia]NGZ45423.1 hypothetical protein [Aquirufa beregesia]
MTEITQPAFYFKVQYGKLEMSFQEVSGLNIESSSLKKDIKHSPIGFKRGLCQNTKSFQTMSNTLSNMGKMSVNTLTISLLNSHGEAIRAWQCLNAYPITLVFGPEDLASENFLVEKLEMDYSAISRTL